MNLRSNSVLFSLVLVESIAGFGCSTAEVTLDARVVLYVVCLDMSLYLTLHAGRLSANAAHPIFVSALLHHGLNPAIQLAKKI